jgi:transcriptional regulator with XRE-family HTH domain
VVSQVFERAASRHARRVRVAAGGDVMRQRTDAGVRRAELARAAGVDESYLRRIEVGDASPSIDTYARLASALGSDLSLRLYPNTGPTIRDRHQARIAEALLAIVHPSHTAYLEIAVRQPSRGWIDLAIHDPHSRTFVATEIQSELRRLEQIVRWSSEKAASLPSWEGWPQLGARPTISKLLIIRDTRATRAVAREFRRTLSTAYPADPDDALAALSGGNPWPGDAILWAKVGTQPGMTRIFARR